MLIGAIEFYYFIPFRLSLTLPGGHKVSAKQNQLASFSSHTFHLIRLKFDAVMKQFNVNILRLLLSEIYRNRWNNCCFTDCVKKINVGMHSDVYHIDLIQTCHNDGYYCTLHFDTSLIGLDLDSRSQECNKEQFSVAIISQSFQLIWMEFGLLLRFVVWWT